MFVLTTLVYPALLAALCIGAGLLVDRCSGSWLPGALLPAVGAAALIALSQLSTYVAPVAPATPYAMAVAAAAGMALGRRKVRTLALRWRTWRWQLAAPALAYVLALAPVLLTGRPSFSAYLALSDSALHMLGADFLIRHGQDYAHLDLSNSYGRYINGYYNTSYPSGSDTLFGGSALLLGLPLIWAFQPFNAFMLATATGPAWLLLRRVGLDRGWAALGSLVVTVPALVYAYDLIGSIKEITSLPMVLTLGALVVCYQRWLRRGASGAIPFALVVAGGVSALGVGFGAWALAAAAVLLVPAIDELLVRRRAVRAVLLLIVTGVVITFVAALPTWLNLGASLRVATNIASTPNPGNLHTPLHSIQVVGTWLWDSYKQLPEGGNRTATYVLIAITLLACLVGAARVIRSRQYPLAAWFALMLLVWLAFSFYATTWVDAKVLMLTSPVVMLLAWGALAAMQASRVRLAVPLLALVLAGGVFVSDALQYHGSNLAPTARYEELARVNTLFAGRGPALFTDFDEYSLYVLRDLDVGGPNFIYTPPALDPTPASYHSSVLLDRLPPAALRAYPLIVTRRDPSSDRPPSAYRLLWQGTYYQVWGRQPGAPAAIADIEPTGPPARECTRIGSLARLAASDRARLLAAGSPRLIRVALAHASHPPRWGRVREGLVMNTPGALSVGFAVPSAGDWNLWLQGQIMPTVKVSVDGHPLASIGAQLGGNSLVVNTLTPLPVKLSRGLHRLSIVRGGTTLAAGDGGTAAVYSIFLTPPRAPAEPALYVLPPSKWRSLCARPYEWIEVVPT